MRFAVPIQLTDDETATLKRWSRGRSTPARLVLRARIVLRTAQGMTNAAIAEELGTDRECVWGGGSGFRSAAVGSGLRFFEASQLLAGQRLMRRLSGPHARRLSYSDRYGHENEEE